MKTKLVAGLMATVTVGAIALAFSSTFQRPNVMHKVVASYDIAGSAPAGYAFSEANHDEAGVAPRVAAIEAPAATEQAARASNVDIPKADLPDGVEPAALTSGLPRIAYTYNYAYRLGGDALPDIQRRHADYCEQQGPRVCRILSLQQNGQEGEYAHGSLVLAVASPRARGFGAELSRTVKAAGGSEVGASISGEDLSKQIVDTEARLRARTLLRDRLMEVLATRRGTVTELVEAERGVAQVNEEIDEARSWLEEMRGRVDFSKVSIDYAAAVPAEGGFASPIRRAVGHIGEVLGTTLAMLIWLTVVLLPLGLLGWIGRKAWLRWHGRRPTEPAAA